MECPNCHLLFHSVAEIHLHMETHHTNASQISKFALEKTTSPIISLDRSTDAFVQQNSKERSSSNPNLLRKTSSDFNTIPEERLREKKILPPLNYKCVLCDIVVTPGSITTFNMHLKSSHFNQELLSEFQAKLPPYLCPHQSCSEVFLKTGTNGRQFNSPMDLLDHMIDAHNLVLEKYYECIRIKSNAAVSTLPSKGNYLCQPFGNFSAVGQGSNSEKNITVPLNENVFDCLICRKNGRNNSISQSKNHSNRPKVQGYNLPLPISAYLNEASLRNHLVDTHFTNLIVKYTEREMKTFLSKSPIVCPLYQVSSI